MSEQPYQLMPDMTDEEYLALKADIDARGVQVPVEVDEQGNVLDGHHRVRACEELGIADYRVIIRSDLTDEEKVEHVLALNLHRRHLSPDQRRQLVIDLRKREWSLRRIAESVGVDASTVSRDLERVAYATPETVTGKDGKQYPARRKSVIAENPREAEVLRKEIEYQAKVESGEIEPIQLIEREPAGPTAFGLVTRLNNAIVELSACIEDKEMRELIKRVGEEGLNMIRQSCQIAQVGIEEIFSMVTEEQEGR